MEFENSNRVFILNKRGKPLMPCKLTAIDYT